MSIQVVAIVPLRLSSVRVPQKILASIGDESLCERTVGRVLSIFSSDPQVLVVAAVDDKRTRDVLSRKYPSLKVVLTDPEIPSGTDRVCVALGEVLKSLPGRGASVRGVLNVQGDIPFVGTEGLRQITGFYKTASDGDLIKTPMATLAQDWPANQDYESPGAVKVISDRAQRAIYFSRHAIPHSKLKARKTSLDGLPVGKLHIGVYGYTPQALAEMCSHSPIALELAEGLEQLRALWLGIEILVLETHPLVGESYRGIDTPEDLAWSRKFAATKGRSDESRAQPVKKFFKKIALGSGVKKTSKSSPKKISKSVKPKRSASVKLSKKSKSKGRSR